MNFESETVRMKKQCWRRMEKKLSLRMLVAVLVSIIVLSVGVTAMVLPSFGDNDVQTMTFYPDVYPENTSIDGNVIRLGVSETFGDIRAGSGTHTYDGGSAAVIRIDSSTAPYQWSRLDRSIYIFPTFALPDGVEILSATLSLWGAAKADGLGITPDVNIYGTTKTSPGNSLMPTDYSTISSTAYCDTPISYIGWQIGSYNDFTLNADGVSAISSTSISKFGVRNANYDASGIAPVWSADSYSFLAAYFSEQGIGYQPKLVVTYTEPAAVPAPIPVPAPVMVSTADYIIYQDSTGFHAVRTEDWQIVESDPSDSVNVINNLLSSLTLSYSIVKPNLYAVGTNPTGFKEGRRVVVTIPQIIASHTIVIPPSEDFIFDMGTSVVYPSTYLENVITIDSCMQSEFILPIVCAGNTGTKNIVNLFPHTIGPDDFVVATTSELTIKSLVSAIATPAMVGLRLDATVANIVNMEINIREMNIVSGIGVYVPSSVYAVLHNTINIKSAPTASNYILKIDPTINVFANRFYIDRVAVSPLLDGSGGRNRIETNP